MENVAAISANQGCCCCQAITLPPPGWWALRGLRTEIGFLPSVPRPLHTPLHDVCVVWVYSRVRLCDSVACSSPGSSVHGIIQEKMGVGCCFLLQGLFLTQGLNPHLLHYRQILYHCKETQDGEAQDPGPREWGADQRNSFSEPNSCIFPCIEKC